MTTIRTQIDAHSPIVAEKTDDGRAIISIEDLNELCELAHEAVHPKDYSIPASNAQGAQRLLDAIFSVDSEGEAEELTGYNEGDEDGADPEIDYREVQIRNLAMQYALGYVTTQIQASHGLDSTSPDLVGHAESILAFLKG